MTSQPRASLANATNVPRHFDRCLAVVLARRHATTTLTWITTGGRSSSVAVASDGLVSILQFRYGLNAVHVDTRHAHVHRANVSTEDDMAKKAKKAKKTAKAATKKVAKKTSRKKK
jgi:hypothetical protein